MLEKPKAGIKLYKLAIYGSYVISECCSLLLYLFVNKSCEERKIKLLW